MKTKYFLLVAAAVAFAACSNNESDNQVQNPDNVIRLNASVGTLTRAASNLLETNFAEGTTVKVQVTDKAATYPVNYDAINYTVGAAGALTGASTQYYPAGGSNVDIYAYYPSSATSDFSVHADQSGEEAYKNSDLMYASISDINKNSNATARTLNFRHKLSKITVTLKKEDVNPSITDAEIARATVKLNDVIIKGTFNPADGSFTAATDEAGNKDDITIGTGAGNHSAIVVPQNVAGKTLTVTIDGSFQTYTIPAETSFAEGKNNIYTITLAKTAISVTSSIADWSTEGAASGSGTLTY